jgi:ABC-type glycerol-3-phosphate transport system substrate-binding protein
MLLIATILVACQPAASPESAGDPAEPSGNSSANNSTVTTGNDVATTILRFAVSMMDQNRYDSLIDAFEAEHPDVHISTVSIEETLGTGPGGFNWPDDAYQLLAANADVIGASATREAVQQGALLDLTDFFESDPNLKADAFYPGLLESVQWEGGTWSLPVEVTYPLIYFDKSLFDAAGMAYPQPGWTWDDFLATAQALTVGNGDAVTQWGFVEPSFDPVTFVQAKAGLLFNADTYPPTARLDDAAVAAAVRWYTDLFLTYEVSPYYSTSGEGGPGGMFRNEGMRLLESSQAAMWFSGGGGMFVGMRRGGPDQQQQTTGAVPFPVSNADDHTTPAVVDGLSISAGTKKADLAWEWISFLAQQPAGQRGPFNALSTGTVPALPSVAVAAGYWDNLDDDFAAALQYATEHATIDTYNGTGYDTFRAAVVDVMDNGTSIETALADAQSEVEAAIEAEVAAAPTPVTDLVVAEEEQQAIDAGGLIINFGLNEGQGRFGQQSMTSLVEQFQAAHPDIIVEVDTPQGFRGQLGLVDMATQYDCFQASPSFDDESLAAIVNMEPFLATDSAISKDDFFPSVLEQFTYQGQLWGLPGSVTINLMNYNKDLFDAAGLPYPSVDWTTSDFLEMAVALTQGEDKDNEQYGYVPSSFAANDLVSIMDRLGADMLDESVDPPRLVFNSPSIVEAFRWYTSLATQYGVQPVVSETTGDFEGGRGSQALISEGRAGMWMDSGGGFLGGPGRGARFGGSGGTADLDVGVVPLPAGPNSAEGSGFQSVDGYFISAASDARQACWSWITFLTEQSTAVTGLPARQSVAESAAYRQQVGAEQADAYLASVSGGSRASFYQRVSDEGNWLGVASFWLSDAYNRVVNDEMTVEESLTTAQESVDAYRDCIITNDAYQDPEAMMQCLSESGANAPRMP